ncbi:STAS domain-containing protein [Actinokineospora sp. NBRC 105648]|uniref:STAS domain-containing protein n=1 Tax=Actinokineospora sp. NBRC 105648 TaxID=3032206 RepID=UPI0024A3CAF2|nr:STAS domain-containing protein [Actinokineospora sp. NBRC 105648]GLZ43089.1 anti-anti-sigma factor [Actinokineospora sp. NBRC 105648]
MTTPLTLSTSRREDGSPVLTVTGEIDMNNADTFTEALTSASEEPLVLDLTGVDYLDSAGLTVLFVNAERIRLLVATPLLGPVLKISGLTELVTTDGIS